MVQTKFGLEYLDGPTIERLGLVILALVPKQSEPWRRQSVLLAISRNFFSEGLLRLRMDHNFVDHRLYVDRWSIRAVHLVGKNVIARSPRYQRIYSCCHCADLRLVLVEVAF